MEWSVSRARERGCSKCKTLGPGPCHREPGLKEIFSTHMILTSPFLYIKNGKKMIYINKGKRVKGRKRDLKRGEALIVSCCWNGLSANIGVICELLHG